MKICCLPVRPLLYTLAALGIFRSGFLIYCSGNLAHEIVPIAYIAFNSFLIYAVCKQEVNTLKWAQRAVLFVVIISFLPAIVLPIVTASYAASGKFDDVSDIMSGNKTEDASHAINTRFIFGLITGFAVEITAAIMVAVEVLKYVLISRIWKAEADLGLYVDSNNFKAP